MFGLGRLRRRRQPREVELSVRAPSLGADADLRVAVSPAFAALAGRPGAGLLSGDPLRLPDPLDAWTARRVLDAVAPSAPAEFATAEALVATARAAFDAYAAARAAEDAWAGVSVAAVAEACAVDLGGGDGGRSDLERFTAVSLDFADWQALRAAPLRDALAYLGHRAAQGAIDSEGR